MTPRGRVVGLDLRRLTAARRPKGMRLLLVIGCLATSTPGCADRTSSAPPPSNVAIAKPATSGSASPTDGRLVWAPDEEAGFARARSEGKRVMVHFSASWCTPCVELERMFEDADVARSINAAFVPLALDVSDGSDEDMAARDRYGAKTLPAIVFISADGKVVGRLSELVDKQGLLDLLARAKR